MLILIFTILVLIVVITWVTDFFKYGTMKDPCKDCNVKGETALCKHCLYFQNSSKNKLDNN